MLQIDFVRGVGWPVSALGPLRFCFYITALLWLCIVSVSPQAVGLQLEEVENI